MSGWPTILSSSLISGADNTLGVLFTPSSAPANDLVFTAADADIMKKLMARTPELVTGFGTSVPITNLKRHIKIASDWNDANCIFAMKHINNTPVVSDSNQYLEDLGSGKTNLVILGPETAPLYLGHLKMEYTPGATEIADTINENKILFDNSDVNTFNITRAMNSPFSNTDSNPLNGIVLSFANNYNNNYAICGYNKLTRDINNQLVVGLALSDDKKGSSVLDIDVAASADTTNTPTFGSFRYQQDTLSVTLTNSVPSNSTLKILNAADSSIAAVPTTITQTIFNNLFSDTEKPEVGPGYQINISVGGVNLTDQGGYNINTTSNQLSLKTYNASNTPENVTPPNVQDICSLDDSNITGNYLYMDASSKHGLFSHHSLVIQNGTFSLPDSSTSSNVSKLFLLEEQAESMEVKVDADYLDLTKPGSVEVGPTNNTPNDSNGRYTKTLVSTNDSIHSLVVAYSTSEVDYINDLGILSEPLQQNPIVEVKVTTLVPSSNTLDAIYNNDDNFVRNDANVNLFFKQHNVNTAYSKTNITHFEAPGMGDLIGENYMGIFSLNKLVTLGTNTEFETFIRSSNNAGPSLTEVLTLATLTSIDLGALGGAGPTRFVLGCKQMNELPPLTGGGHWVTDSGNQILNIDPNNFNITNGNNSFLISGIDCSEVTVDDILSIMSHSGDSLLNVQLEWRTSSIPVSKRNALSNTFHVTYYKEGVTPEPVEKLIDSTEIQYINPVTATPVHLEEYYAGGTGLSTRNDFVNYKYNGNNVPSYFKVHKYSVTKTYKIAALIKIGPFKNLWYVSDLITEVTEYYTLENVLLRKIMPNRFLQLIVDAYGAPVYNSRRYFNSPSVHSVISSVSFARNDLMGFYLNMQYLDDDNVTWVDFYYASNKTPVDLFFNTQFSQTFYKDVLLAEALGTSNVNIDVPQALFLGNILDADIIENAALKMYIINIEINYSIPQFNIIGRRILMEEVAPFLHNWNPDLPGNQIFPKNENGDLLGEPILNIRTDIEVSLISESQTDIIFNLICTDTHHSSHPNNEYLILKLISNKNVLEEFNILYHAQTIIKNEYNYGRTTNSLTTGTEYKLLKNLNTTQYYSPLNLGNNYNGVAVKCGKTTQRNDTATFTLLNDFIKATPIVNGGCNSYSGKYSNFERIAVSSAGYPVPTNSTKQRNIGFNSFRGFIPDQTPIQLTRTASKIKFVASNPTRPASNNTNSADYRNKCVSSLDVNELVAATMWTNRGSYTTTSYKTLIVKQLLQGSFSNTELSNFNSSVPYTTTSVDIGDLSLAITTKYSMLPSSNNSSSLTIPIHITFAKTHLTIGNPLNTDLERDIISDVSNPIIKSFLPFNYVATRIKAYQLETHSFLYATPPLKIYFTEKFIGNVENFPVGDWRLIHTLTDAQIRQGLLLDNKGVVSVKRTLANVSSYTAYSIHGPTQAALSAYDPASLPSNVNLPTSLNLIAKTTRYFDLQLANSNGTDGLVTNSHTPFSKSNPVSITNPLNDLASTSLLNNISVNVKVVRNLLYKENSYNPVSFTIPSNNLKITHFLGTDDSDTLPEVLFNGPISSLNNYSTWPIDEYDNKKLVTATLRSNKTWEVVFRQRLQTIASYMPLMNSQINLPNITISGISHFGTATYNLNLVPADSTQAIFYKVVITSSPGPAYNISAILYRYKSVVGISWSKAKNLKGLTTPYIFSPTMVEVDKAVKELNIPQTLTSTPFNIQQCLIDAVNDSSNFPSVWTPTTFTVDENKPILTIPSPTRLTTLSTTGNTTLLDILYVDRNIPYKVIAINRPDILRMAGPDNGTLFSINPDGKFFMRSLVSQENIFIPNPGPESQYTPNTLFPLISYSLHPLEEFL